MLVENYQLTTPVGLRIGREFLDKTSMKTLVLSLQLSSCCRALETERGLGEGFVVCFACAVDVDVRHIPATHVHIAVMRLR